MNLALHVAAAVTCDTDFRVIENATIQVAHDRIAYVGPRDSALPFEADDTLEGEHLVALPGLVNVHTHAAMTLVRGYADDMALEPWLEQKIWPYEANLRPEHVYQGTLLAIAEMVRGGTTCFADMYFFEREGVRAMLESGIRACPGAVLLGFLPDAERKIRDGIAWAREMNGAGEGRIQTVLAPHSLYTCDDAQWRQLIDGARENNLLLHTHASETRREVSDVTAKWGQSPIQTLEKWGALEGPLLAAHCVHTDERDREIMAERGLRVAHNPQSNLKLASGIAPIDDYLKRAITVGLGPDGTASNNNLDMWEEMRLAATLHKAATGDPTAVSAREALEMATKGGAKCLGMENEIGSLEVGKKADIVLVDFDKPHLRPRHNVVSHLVYAVNCADVHSTLVNGQFLLRDGNWTTLDVQKIGRECEAIARELVALAV